MNRFEDHLLARLRADHGADGVAFGVGASRRPRARALAGAAGTLAAAVTAAVLVLTATGHTTKAYAVTRDGNGEITVTLSDIQQMNNLNAEFKQDGYPITAIPVEANCTDQPGILPSVGPSQPMSDSITLGTDFQPGQVEVIGAAQLASGQVELNLVTMAAGTAPSCFREPQSGWHTVTRS